MKKYLLAVGAVLLAFGAQAQSKKHLANFSLFQQFYNPALTGYEGSMIKGYHRNQWAGFEGAPNTYFVSAEIDMADLAAWKKDNQLKTRLGDEFDRQQGAKQAFGLAVFSDEFGGFSEQQVQLGYGSRVRLSEQLSLRWGSALTLGLHKLDGSKLVIDKENDQRYLDVLGQTNRVGRVDLNMGLMLTSDAYYLGYAMQDVSKKGLLTSGSDFMKGMFVRKHVVQAGYRRAVSEQVGLVVNGLFQYDDLFKESVEGQLKAIYQNVLWVGAGYRKDLAYTMQAGVRVNQFKIGYVYEVPTGEASSIKSNTNEIMLTYNLIPVKYPKYSRRVISW